MSKSVAEVRDITEYLERDSDIKEMHAQAKSRQDLYSMLDIPDLPDHMHANQFTVINTPLLIHITNSILADVEAFNTSVVVTPFGPGHQDEADKIEQWAALFRQRVNDGGRVDREKRQGQLGIGWAVNILHFGDPSKGFPWTVEVPAFDTCFFPVTAAPCRPSILARRFKMTVRDAQKRYSNYRGFSEGRRLAWENGVTDWVPMSDDRSVEGATTSGGMPKPWEEIEILAVYDEDYICHIVDKGGMDAKGLIVWESKQLAGGVNAVIVPGNTSNIRKGSERYEPILWAIQQQVKMMNRIRAWYATEAENMKPDIVAAIDPDKAQAIDMAGMNPTDDSWQQGGPRLVSVAANTLQQWPLVSNPNIDKLAIMIQQETDRYLANLTEVSNPEVLQDIKANVYLTVSESRRRQLGPFLKHSDWAWAELTKMALHSIEEYDTEFPLYAAEDMEYSSGKNLSRGSNVTINAADVKGWDYDLKVFTRSVSESEQRMRLQDWSQRYAMGISTFLEGGAAAGYTDEKKWLASLFEDAAFRENQAWVDEQMRLIVQNEMMLTSRLQIPPAPTGVGAGLPMGPGAEQMAPGGGGLPPAMPTGNIPGTGFNPLRPAALDGSVGGSAAPMNGDVPAGAGY